MALSETIAKTSEEIEKEASSYPVITFADILRALKKHPDWLQELRKLILTEELLELPRKFDELIKRVEKIESDVEVLKQDVAILKQDVAILKQDVAMLKQDVAILKQDVAMLKQDVAILKQDVAILKQDVAILKQDVAMLKQDVAVLKMDVELLKKDVAYLKGEFGRFKGRDFERTIRERYYAYFGKLLRRSKRIELEVLLPQIEDLLDEGVISEEQYDSILRLDLIVEGELRATRKPVVLAVEISYTVFEDDLKKASERADILSTILKKEVIPTVVGVEIKKEALSLADEQGILVLKTDF